MVKKSENKFNMTEMQKKALNRFCSCKNPSKIYVAGTKLVYCGKCGKSIL